LHFAFFHLNPAPKDNAINTYIASEIRIASELNEIEKNNVRSIYPEIFSD